jgi:hypothetical protein
MLQTKNSLLGICKPVFVETKFNREIFVKLVTLLTRNEIMILSSWLFTCCSREPQMLPEILVQAALSLESVPGVSQPL